MLKKERFILWEIYFMKYYSTIIRELYWSGPLCWRTIFMETQKVKELILYSEGQDMIKNIFQAFEALVRAIMYLFILLIGLTATGLGVYIVFFLAIRIGQFLWILIFKEPWI